MELSGEHVAPAPRARVWDALNDPAVLKACIPGLQSLEKTSDTEFAAVVAARIGPVNARFKGRVTLSALDPPNGYTISGEGTGGAAGFARGEARVRLADADGGATRLTWEADARVGGKLAQVGSRLVGGVAKRLADEFFSKFAGHVAGGAAPAEDPPASEAPAPKRRKRLGLWVLAAAAMAAGALAAALAGGGTAF